MSLKDYSLNLTEQEYHDYPCWSYSMISKYAKEGFGAIATIHEHTKPTQSMEFGSLLDCILTRGKDVSQEYIVDTTGIAVPPAEKEVFDKLLSLGLGDCSFDEINTLHYNTLIEVMDSCESFCSKYKKLETKLSNLDKNKKYYDMRRTGKKIISMTDWQDALDMAKAIKTHPTLKDIFGTGKKNGKEYLYQLQFKIPYETEFGVIELKIMPDLLVVDNNEKTVQPVDLKTSSAPSREFADNFVKFRYDIQASLYTYVIQQVMNQHKFYSSYTILPYLFTDISRTDKLPLTFVYDPTDVSQINGLSFGTDDKVYQYKGWPELLNEILSYEKSNAVVPNGMSTTEPNDIIKLLSTKR